MMVKRSNVLKELSSLTVSFGIPAIAQCVVSELIFKNIPNRESPEYILTVAGISIVCGLLFALLYESLLPLIPWFRKWLTYEGIWLEMIPDFERPYSIMKFEYNSNTWEYELHGMNFNKELSGGINFDAYKFAERTAKDGFYYITNQTSEHKNGLCKICFIQYSYDDLMRAEGYFFDSSSAECSKKHDTILVKCDKEFFKKIIKPNLPVPLRYKDLFRMQPQAIAELCQAFADTEIEKYHKNKTSADNNNLCQNCAGFNN